MFEGKKFADLAVLLIRLVILFALIGVTVLVVSPFFNIILWGLLLAIIFYPMYTWLLHKTGKKKKLTIMIVTIVLVAVVLIPSFLFFESTIKGVKTLGSQFADGSFSIPSPNDRIAKYPVGDQIYELWSEASENLVEFVGKYDQQFGNLGKTLLSSILGTGKGVLQFVLAIFVSIFFLNISNVGGRAAKNFYIKIVGEVHGEEYLEITIQTIRNVAKGIIGVALVQAVFLGLGFQFAGVPHPGLWALLCLMLTITQIGPMWVTIPIIIWVIMHNDPLPATFWSIYIGAGTLIDNILKPILMGKGGSAPMVLIFIGAIGGFITLGFIGLFIGAIIISIFYQIFMTWNEGNPEKAIITKTEKS